VIQWLTHKKSFGGDISSDEVRDELSKRFPREQDYESKQVRDVVKALWLENFPLSVTMLK